MEYFLAKKDDLDNCVRMRLLYILEENENLDNDTKLSLEKTLKDYFSRRLNKDVFCFMAKEDNKVIGMAVLLIIERPASVSMINGLCGEVLSVIVDKEYRNRGIAYNIMSNLISFSKEKELCRINLRATSKGLPLYKKLGFIEHPYKCTEMAYFIKEV